MPWFKLFNRTNRTNRPAAVLRTRLGLEQLDARAVPSTLAGDGPEPLDPPAALMAPPTGAPQIVEFTAEEVNHGWYLFTGRVVADSPGGLTVTFGGVPSLDGQTVVTESDGTFSLLIQVQTDGSDSGTVTTQTVANGQQSNVAYYDITPTP